MKKTLRLNVPLRGKQVGETVVCDCDADGKIIDSYWRARLDDAVIDNCVTEVKPQAVTSKKGAE